MATNQNNIHVNSFTKGMNSDTSVDMIGNDQYMFGMNIRITTNALLKAISDSNSREGIVAPVPVGKIIDTEGIYDTSNYRILAVGSIENIGYVIIADDEKESAIWHVYRAILNDDETISFSLQFTSNTETSKQKFSTVINKEIEGVVKLYIADGDHQLMIINLMDDEYNSRITGNTDAIISNRLYPDNKIQINNVISGRLPTCQVQYTYRLYKKYGVFSKLAPLTNKIQIIDRNRNKEEGCAQNTKTSIGLSLTIPNVRITTMPVDYVFDHVQVYRLMYKNVGENAEVHLIYDSFIKENAPINIEDTEEESIQQLSIEEFSALGKQVLIPQNIEQNQNYLFEGNVKDDTLLKIGKDYIDIDSKVYQYNLQGKIPLSNITNYTNIQYFNSIEDVPEDYYLNKYSDINKEFDYVNYPDTGKYAYFKFDRPYSKLYFGAQGKNISCCFITADIPVHDNFNMFSPNVPYTISSKRNSKLSVIDHGINVKTLSLTTDDYFLQHKINPTVDLSYDNILTSSMLRSLKRNEVYRYGIVYYDKYGRRSDVQWIGDLRTPVLKESNNFKFVTGQTGEKIYGASNSINTSTQLYRFHVRTLTDIIYSDSPVTKLPYIEGEKYIIWENSSNSSLRFKVTQTVIYVHQANPDENMWSTSIPFEEWIAKYGTPGYDIHFETDSGSIGHIGHQIEVGPNQNVYVVINKLPLELTKAPRYEKDGVKYYNVTEQGDPLGLPYGDVIKCYINFTLVFRMEYSYINISESYSGDNLMARPLGLMFNVSVPKKYGITSFQIVRCQKSSQYSRTLMQCAISRPVRQRYSNAGTGTIMSPWYPIPFLSSQFMGFSGYMKSEDKTTILNDATNTNNYYLVQMFSPEINLYQKDSCSKISSTDSKLSGVQFCYSGSLFELSFPLSGFQRYNEALFTGERWTLWYHRHLAEGSNGEQAINFKSGSSCNIFYYKLLTYLENADGWKLGTTEKIESVSNVQNPTWEQGFSNIQLSGSKIIAGVKAYKSFTSIVKNEQYVNWVCNGMYNLRLTKNESQSNVTEDAQKVFTYLGDDCSDWRDWTSQGWIGPGPKCLLAKLEQSKNPDGTLVGTIFNNGIKTGSEMTLGTVVCDVVHTAQQFSGLTKHEHQFETYYGFGNYGKLEPDSGENMTGSLIVFDGDIYNLPCEYVSMFKTYNFNSIKDTLPSAQIVNYVPMETKINTFFDYGMNYRNTQSPNLQLEPGEITGISSQDRPLNQYNPIYSDNNISNDIYTAQSEEEDSNIYTQRIYYSQLKTDGESIDNWGDFRALNYIDTDSRYGKITHLMTNNDILYFWQTQAFGRLSVNERSLITDNNNNTIQLGQGGVLQRTDYIDTKHGMQEQHHSSIGIGKDVMWIDVSNKAILAKKGDNVINYGEMTNVQNILNDMSNGIPDIEYDVQNQELLCKCFDEGKQIVFNIKLNVATSVYTRKYDDIISYNNVLYGLSKNNVVKYSFLTNEDCINEEFLNPTILQFSVNANASITKTFDTQQLVMLSYNNDENFAENFAKDKILTFITNLNESSYDHKTEEIITDREGNIQYAIPRSNNAEYGNRLKGKWMKVTIEDENPKYDNTISHIITKFRQSFI